MQEKPNPTAYLRIEHGELTTLGDVQEARTTIADYNGTVLEDTERGIVAAFNRATDGGSVAEYVQAIREVLAPEMDASSVEVIADDGQLAASAYGKIAVRGTAVYVDGEAASKWLRDALTAMRASGDTHVKIELTGYREDVPTLTTD